MEKSEKTLVEKEAIIAEYLLGKTSYRKLGKLYDIDFRMIHSWVTKYKGEEVKKHRPRKTQEKDNVAFPSDVKELQEELRKAKLYNKLLNTMIDIAEDQLNIDIRKKSGTKR